MKLFYNKSQRNLFLVVTVLMAVIDMTWREWGSFDPRESGFWLAIGKSLLFSLFLNSLMKFPDPHEKKEDRGGQRGDFK